MEEYLIVLRFKDMRVKEIPEDGGLRCELSTDSRWTDQSTLFAESFLIMLNKAVDSANCLHV